jgi:imidazole glycerol-phosphate synthase subunit HisF
MTRRIIPRLDIKGPNLVKGIHLEGLRVLGAPHAFAKHYYEQGADELFFMDVVASLYERNSLLDMVQKTAESIFVPLIVGGGIRTIEDVTNALRAGADKVSINTAATRRPSFVNEVARKFGSSTIVVAIEAIKQSNGDYHAFTDNARQETGLEVVQWAKQVESLGAGELVLTSVDREGTGAGLDLDLLEAVAKAVRIPVVAHGGAKSPEDIATAFTVTDIDAVSVASIWHYGALGEVPFEAHREEGNHEFRLSGRIPRSILGSSIVETRQHLLDKGIDCRVLLTTEV